jgi:hypothetical protein
MNAYTTRGARVIRAAVRQSLERQGFDVSNYPRDSCATAVINGIPAHERSCPNTMHECNGCNNLVPMRIKYCGDCQ